MEGRTFFVGPIVMGALVLGLLGSIVNALLLGPSGAVRWREGRDLVMHDAT